MNSNDINSNLTVEQKFAKAMLHLRKLRPFYSAVYEVMKKEKSESIPTLAVDTDTLYYNEKFVDSTPFNEFLFIVLHEIAHVALLHVVRKEHRDHSLWNIACDLYVNQVLAQEFNLNPGQTTDNDGINVSMPNDLVFASSLDVDVDYTEQIYDELEKQAKKNGYFRGRQPLTMGDSGQGQTGQVGEQGKNQPGSSQQGQGQGDSESTQGQVQEYGHKFIYTGSGKQFGEYSKFEGTINPDYAADLIDSGEDISQKRQKAEKVISDAMVKVEMSGNNYGDGSNNLMILSKKMLKSEVDWRRLLRRYLVKATSKDSSFNRPDKRMYYQKYIYPGVEDEEDNTIKGLKVCIDTSGSISDTDIAYFCGQVYDISKQFKIEAELVYWDSSVQSTGEFKDYKEFDRIDCSGRGGTDPSVVFDYFDSKKCKRKPIVTLMFTDGYFSVDGISSKQRKRYKDTIWVMTKECNKEFKPPFGIKTTAKFGSTDI